MALPIFIGEKMAKHILSCSFGKDSIATALLALQHGEPLDELVYCEVMFNEEISGELRPHSFPPDTYRSDTGRVLRYHIDGPEQR